DDYREVAGLRLGPTGERISSDAGRVDSRAPDPARPDPCPLRPDYRGRREKEASGRSVGPYWSRERIIRSYDFSFSRQNSSMSSVSGAKYCIRFTVNGRV